MPTVTIHIRRLLLKMSVTKKNQETALKMGQESVVLLENKEGLLPIDKRDAIGNICVTGPLADVWQLELVFRTSAILCDGT